VVLALAVLGACTAGSSADGAASDSKSTAVGSTASPLPPGKYQTLPQPCTAVDLDTLKQLVPSATDYAGKESLTYDTDRRVGCSWTATASTGTTLSLSVDLERVVSYDPSISDEVQAETDFDQKAQAADIPLISTSDASTSPPASPAQTTSSSPASPSSPSSGPGGTGTATGTSGGLAADSGTSAPASTPTTPTTPTSADSSPDPDLAPRLLANVGNAAFINDVLKTPSASATTGPSRDVTVVFRTANVVVTVTYVQTAPSGSTAPASTGLQDGAQDVAGQLESRIEG